MQEFLRNLSSISVTVKYLPGTLIASRFQPWRMDWTQILLLNHLQVFVRCSAPSVVSTSMASVNATLVGRAKSVPFDMMNVKFPTAMDMDTAWVESANACVDTRESSAKKVHLTFVKFSILKNSSTFHDSFLCSGLSAPHVLRSWLLRRWHMHLQEGLEGPRLRHNGQGCTAVPTWLHWTRYLQSRHSSLQLWCQMEWRWLLKR